MAELGIPLWLPPLFRKANHAVELVFMQEFSSKYDCTDIVLKPYYWEQGSIQPSRYVGTMSSHT